LQLAHTIYHLPTYPIIPLFYKTVKNIQLHKEILHYCVFYHGVAMIEQNKKIKENLVVNLHSTMNDLLEDNFNMLSKIQLFIGNMNVFFQEIMFWFFYLKHGYQILVTTLMFPYWIKLDNKELMYALNLNAHLALNLGNYGIGT